MLPSRPRLERWNPDSLTPAGDAVKNSGKAVGEAVSRIDSNLKTMPETKAWSGDAHNAATAMFGRAKKQTDDFSKYTTAVGDALSGAAGPIGSARTALLKKADEIDNSGQLHVSDQWVVLVKGGQMTVEQAAALEKRAQSEQITVNRLLTDVGAADEAGAAAVTAAGQSHGLQLPDPTSLDRMYPGALKPGDEVPNPFSYVGATQQAILRDTEMSQTVRETKVETQYNPNTGEAVATTTTRYMMDGSKHIETVDAKPNFSDRGPLTTNVHIDKNGNEVSRTTTVTYNNSAQHGMAGKTTSTTVYANGTVANVTKWPDGKEELVITEPNKPPTHVPVNLIDHPILTPLGATGKYFGPGVSVATSLWDIAVAQSSFERCVAIAEGVTSVTTGTLGGIAASGTGPLAIPISMAAALGGETLGNWIGNTFCPR
ncbi:WXG100 family type VII secretion target [Mycolicibacterium fortuitum]|uniref:WXG100 family type VII secretion target n=1 Tax=Mycolicibacterium fortuitum TaxID=1766 RepID=UPI003AABC7ED